jgi:hypothetical protein
MDIDRKLDPLIHFKNLSSNMSFAAGGVSGLAMLMS